MKKRLLTMMLFVMATCGFAQNTYYWAGGSTATSLTGSDWSTTLGGVSTTARSATNDILIFDNKTVVFSITTSTIGKLVIRNNSDVTFTRATLGSGTLTISQGSGVGLEIDNAIFRIASPTSGFKYTVDLASGATATVKNGGQIFITGVATSRITTRGVGSLVFDSGTSANVNSSDTNPFNTVSSNGLENTVVFNDGAILNYNGGLSPFGSSGSSNVIQLSSGSITNINVAPTVSGTFKNRVFGNLIIKTGVTLDLNSTLEDFIKVNNLTIESGANLTLRTTAGNSVAGNLLVNGTLGAGLGVDGTIGSSQLIMVGTTPQSIAGSGPIRLGAFSVAKDANVTLNKSLEINGSGTSNMIGKLNFGTNIISGSGNVNFRNASSITNVNATIVTNSNSIVIGAGGDTNPDYAALNPVVGLLVTGTGIPVNSYIVGTSSSSSTITISNFATSAGTSIDVTGDAATFITSNTGGTDASLVTTGNATATKFIGSGTNLILNAVTSTPFPVTFFTTTVLSVGSPITYNPSVLQSNINFGNVTFNSPATTNTDATITGALTLNTSKLTIRPSDNLTMTATSSFANTSSSSYVVTDANTGTGTVGTLKLVALAASKLIPVGSANNYLPITLNPVSASDFSINVFQGATTNAAPNGTAIADKSEIVDAIYNVNRTSGSGNCNVTLGWDAGLEGGGFNTIADNQIGAAQFSGSYGSFAGTGNNNNNTVVISGVSTFAPFIVGKIGTTTLPVTLTSFSAQKQALVVQLKWNTASEQNNSHFDVQRSTDGITFSNMGKVMGAGNSSVSLNYFFTDKSPASGVNYYRLSQVDFDGKTTLSNPVSVNMGFGNSTMQVYAMSNSTDVNINISTEQVSRGQLVIYNISGQKVFEQAVSLTKGNNTLTVNMLNADKGVFIATYSADSQMLKQKFIR
jgi:hypothetical protein